MIRIAMLCATALVASPVAARTIAVAAGPGAQERLQGALLDAKPGDVVAIGAGRFDLTDGLSLDVPRVTLRGAGRDRTVLSFKGQLGAGEGLLVTSDDVVLRGFAVEDTRGDGIKSKGANRIVYTDLRVEWTGGPKETNGAYGVYPVSSSQVLIDGVIVKGASDAGIYVGQSEQIIVRNSMASGNVAGIEIENSRHADVFHNNATHNTGGILVFDLPNLPRLGETSGDSAERRDLFEQFRIEVTAHAAAEEESLYATMLARPDLRDDARHSVSEHKEIDDFLGELADLDMATGAWLTRFKAMRHRYEHHIDEEEEEMFPAAAEKLSDEEEARLAKVFEARKPKELARAEAEPAGGDERE